MPTFVSLVNWTDQGIKTYRDSVRRAEDYRGLVEKHGGQVRQLVWTLGEYDIVVVTDDNPRSEDPAAIRARIIAGAETAVRRDGLSTRVLDGGDRRSAIRCALELAGADDVIAILGKGHETGQQIGVELRPFSDAEVVLEEWRARS